MSEYEVVETIYGKYSKYEVVKESSVLGSPKFYVRKDGKSHRGGRSPALARQLRPQRRKAEPRLGSRSPRRGGLTRACCWRGPQCLSRCGSEFARGFCANQR